MCNIVYLGDIFNNAINSLVTQLSDLCDTKVYDCQIGRFLTHDDRLSIKYKKMGVRYEDSQAGTPLSVWNEITASGVKYRSKVAIGIQ